MANYMMRNPANHVCLNIIPHKQDFTYYTDNSEFVWGLFSAAEESRCQLLTALPTAQT